MYDIVGDSANHCSRTRINKKIIVGEDPKDEKRSLPGSPLPWKVPPSPGRTDQRCFWVNLVPRFSCVSVYPAGPPAGADVLRGCPASGRRRPPEAVRVYKLFLAWRSLSGRICPLVTPTDPGFCDHLAAVVIVAQVSLPGRPSTRFRHMEESLPGQAFPLPSTCRVHRVARPGFLSPPAASRSPFGVEHTGTTPAQWPRPGTSASTGVFVAASGLFALDCPSFTRDMTVYLPVPEMLRSLIPVARAAKPAF
ncbi:hypothetical protein MRX96_042209 [Rhipicephalus microplus]